MRILVVDDHAEMLAKIEQYLASSGHHVSVAESAEQAMQIVEASHDYDVVVTDIAMPGMNGIEMWEKMNPLLPDTKVIFISSTNNSSLQHYLPGPFLPKPFRLADLHACVLNIRTAVA